MIWSRSYPIIIYSAHNIPWENDASGARRRRCCWKAQERLFEKTAGETVHGGKEEEEGSSSAAFRQKKGSVEAATIWGRMHAPALEAVVASLPVDGSRGSSVVEASATMAENATQHHIGSGGGGTGRDIDWGFCAHFSAYFSTRSALEAEARGS